MIFFFFFDCSEFCILCNKQSRGFHPERVIGLIVFFKYFLCSMDCISGAFAWKGVMKNPEETTHIQVQNYKNHVSYVS